MQRNNNLNDEDEKNMFTFGHWKCCAIMESKDYTLFLPAKGSFPSDTIIGTTTHKEKKRDQNWRHFFDSRSRHWEWNMHLRSFVLELSNGSPEQTLPLKAPKTKK